MLQLSNICKVARGIKGGSEKKGETGEGKEDNIRQTADGKHGRKLRTSEKMR